MALPPRKIARVSVRGTDRRRQTRSTLPGLDLSTCLLCQSEKRKRKDRRRQEKMVRCTLDCTAETLLNAARIRQDERVLLEIEGADIHAKDVIYHASCYKDFTSPRQLDLLVKKQLDDEECGTPHRRAFMRLARDVEVRILGDSPEVLSLSDLTIMYKAYLQEMGVPAESYRAHALKARLTRHFGNRLSFHRPRRQHEAQYVFSSSAVAGPLIDSMQQRMDTESRGSGSSHSYDDSTDDYYFHAAPDDETSSVYAAATILRQKLLSLPATMPFPPTPADVVEHNINIPSALYNFLCWLMEGDRESDDINLDTRVTPTSDAMNRRILSIGQDIIYCCSGGRIKTPKHVALPITLKQLTGSTQVVTLLNRFGHGISESQLSECETAMAKQQVERQKDGGTFIPANIREGSFVTLCWDNNDICEETLSGEGTTHCTNGIVVQRVVPILGLLGEGGQSSSIPNRHERSFKLPSYAEFEYNAGTRQEPSTLQLSEHAIVAQKHVFSLNAIDFTWLMSRFFQTVEPTDDNSDGGNRTPGWAGFNSLIRSKEAIRMSTVGYLPVIPMSPTLMTTVYTLIQRSVAIANELNQESVVIVVDQAIYCKAQDILWKNKEQFSNVVLRMGAFHICLAFLSVIGKRFGDAGLCDLIVESGVVGSSAANGVLAGKHYNRGIRVHKLMFEALHGILWKKFQEWQDNASSMSTSIESVKVPLESLADSNFNIDSFNNLTHLPDFHRLHDEFLDYCNQLDNPLAKFWLSYLSMVDVLLNFIRSSRIGDWHLHLHCIREMLPWFFAYDRVNYSRYLSLYWSEMKALPKTHPDVYEQFVQGEFCVQRSNVSFSQIPVDQTIEQTVNRDTKTKGGIIGFSQKPDAVQRWLINAHQRAEMTTRCREMAGFERVSAASHKDCAKSRIVKDKMSVQSLTQTLSASSSPFPTDDGTSLINIVSGIVATDELKHDLLEAYNLGEDKFVEFVQDRLASTKKRFHEPISKMKLKTFAVMSKAKAVKVVGREVMVRADRNLFARLLVVAQHRALDLREVLSYELGPVPWSIATVDGNLVKTSKAKLLEVLEKDFLPADNVPSDSAWLIDGMAQLQSISRSPATFSDLALTVFDMVTVPFRYGCRRVDFVVDTYPAVSIKGLERRSRTRQGIMRVVIIDGTQKCPSQWKKFMSVDANKVELIEFLYLEWRSSVYAAKLHGRYLFVTHGSMCSRLTSHEGQTVEVTKIPSLECSHEEADTRLILHAAHAEMSGYQSVVIRCPDTDVAVIACTLSRHLQTALYFRTGTKARARYINIQGLRAHLGDNLCNCLIGLHALTGCDSTSAFKRKGKKAAVDILTKDSDEMMCRGIGHLGVEFNMTEDVFRACEAFVCKLYGFKDCTKVNECRYRLFSLKAASGESLPPTEDALRKHVQRANYQAGIWQRALECKPDVPSPCENGWTMKNNDLSIDWMKENPAPDELLLLIHCQCQTGCATARCSCKRTGMPCTDACSCKSCSNSSNVGYDDDVDIDDSDDDE